MEVPSLSSLRETEDHRRRSFFGADTSNLINETSSNPFKASSGPDQKPKSDDTFRPPLIRKMAIGEKLYSRM